MLLIVAGAYHLNMKENQGGFWKPFKALIGKKGPRYMLLVAFIWSITSNIDKVGILNSSVVFWVISTHLASALFFVPLVLFRIHRQPAIFKWSELRPLILIGLAAILRSVLQMSAIAMTLVAYVISIKRTSVIFGILFGYVIFREKGLSERLTGAVIMVAGVFVIAWF
jgi:uncharacterized membrane protein